MKYKHDNCENLAPTPSVYLAEPLLLLTTMQYNFFHYYKFIAFKSFLKQYVP